MVLSLGENNEEQALTIRAAGVDFYAQQRGERPDTLFVHGFGGDLHFWDSLWAALGGKLQGLRYDLRGFGRSLTDSDEPFSHSEDLLAILDALAIEQCDLVGLSMGGAVALNFALNHPQRVRRLVLISPGLVAWEWSDEWKALWRPIFARARDGDMDGARELWWQHPLFATTRGSDSAQILYDSVQRYSGAQWIRDNERQELPDIDRLQALQVPTLLLTGGRDMQEFRLMADAIESCAPNIQRVDFPDLGHLVCLEDAPACAAQILRFLN